MAAPVSSSTQTLKCLSPADNKACDDCLNTCKKVHASIGKYLILVNVTAKKLHLIESPETDRKLVNSYSISTAAAGTGQVEESSQTPLGLHRICEKIGEGEHSLEIFKSRQKTGSHAIENGTPEIVGRILRLEGLEPGYNRGQNDEGQNVDSYLRYVYLHGTNRRDEIGKAASNGCIRMDHREIVQFFPLVPNGTNVYVYT